MVERAFAMSEKSDNSIPLFALDDGIRGDAAKVAVLVSVRDVSTSFRVNTYLCVERNFRNSQRFKITPEK